MFRDFEMSDTCLGRPLALFGTSRGDSFGVSRAPAGTLWAVFGSPGALWLSCGASNYETVKPSIPLCQRGTHPLIPGIPQI